MRAYTKWDHEPRSLPSVQTVLARAYRIAMEEPRGPVYIARRINYKLYERRHPDEPWLAQDAVRYVDHELRREGSGFEWVDCSDAASSATGSIPPYVTIVAVAPSNSFPEKVSAGYGPGVSTQRSSSRRSSPTCSQATATS